MKQKEGLDKISNVNDHPVLKKLSKIAQEQLREDDHTKKETLSQLREWLKQNKDVENVRDDDTFLLRFLRTKKFSLLMAQQQLLKYLNFRKVLKPYMTELDFLSPNLSYLIDRGYMFASPIRDKYGRRVIITQMKYFDIDRCSSFDMAKVHMLTYETLVDEEPNQILGFVHIGDAAGVSPRFLAIFNITDFLRIMRWGEKSMPMRHKEIHIINIIPTVKYVIDGTNKYLSNKIQERARYYLTLEDFQKSYDTSVIPEEMGGKIPMATMIELWKRELATKRDRLLKLDQMQILSTRGIYSSRNMDQNGNMAVASGNEIGGTGIIGSFRKLDID